MTDRPRRVALAVLLSLFGVGIGQVYNGEARKALVLNAFLLVLFVAGLLLIQSSAFLLALFLVLVGSVGSYLFALIDAVLGSLKRSKSYGLAPYNRVFVYALLILASNVLPRLAVPLVRENWVQAFRIPSEAMQPTLLVGDYLFVDKRASARRPEPGDVVVFQYPEEPSRSYIKRVVAVGGEAVEVRAKTLFVNGKPRAEAFIQHIDPTVHEAGYDPRDHFGPFTVPAGSYFVMGDNRDNSNDSRFWGPVRGALMQGKVIGIYWSWDAAEEGPRSERIGSRVR